MRIHAFLVVFFLFLLMGKSIGQQSMNVVTEQLWIDFNPEWNIHPKWNVYGRVDVRTIFPNNWNRYIMGGGVSYKRKPYISQKMDEEFHAGIGFFYTDYHEVSNRLEIRPYQGYKLKWPNLPRFKLQNYVRLEERFEIITDGGGNEFGWRFRYQIQATLQCSDCDHSFLKPFYFPMNAEFFINLDNTSQFNDVVRIGPGVGYRFDSGWKPEFDLTFNRTRSSATEAFSTSDVVFRLRLFYKFPVKQTNP